MFQFLNRLVRSAWPLPQRSRRTQRRIAVAPPACESLESREMLAAAGIAASVSTLRVVESSAIEFSVNWEPTGSGDADSVGMNLRIHYDSSALQFSSVTDIYQAGFSAQQETAEADDRDDGATSTDRVAKLLWVDLEGAWPSLAAGSRLLTIQFQTQPGFGSTVINLDATTVNDMPLPRRQVTVNQVPVLTGPASSNLTARPEIAWTSVPNVAYYDIWISKASAGTHPYLRTTAETNTFTPTVDLDINVYRVWVQGAQANGVRLGWSAPRLFDVRPRGTMVEPVGTVATSTPVIKWLPVAGAATYDLWVDNVSTGQSQVIRKQDVTDIEYVVSQPLPMGTYWSWVQGINADSFRASWSYAAKFTVAPSPTLLEPLAPTFDTTPTFSWSSVPGASRYDLWVSNLSTGQGQVIRQTHLTATSYTPLTPLENSNYVWWVQAISNTGITSQWSRGEFSVGGRPKLLAPSGPGQPTSPVFQWTSVIGAVEYDLWVNKDDGPAQIIRQTTLTTNSYTPLTPLGNGTYRFWVQAVSGTGAKSLWSESLTFTIG